MVNVLKYCCILSTLVLFGMFTSCVDNNVANLDNSLIFTPEYSVPIGFGEFTMADAIASPGFDTIPADTANWSDSLYFEYDSNYYYLPTDAIFDTILHDDFDFSLIGNWLDNATYLMFRMNLDNGIPGDVLLQVAFLDINNTIVFVLFDNSGIEIPAATTNSSSFRQNDTYLSLEEINSLRDVRQINVYIRLNIENLAKGVSYSPDQFFKFQMGLQVGLLMDPNEEAI